MLKTPELATFSLWTDFRSAQMRRNDYADTTV